MSEKLKNEIALVSGGNTGIGRAVAVAFAREGADVAVAWISRQDAANSLVEHIQSLGRRAVALQCDVTDEVNVKGLFAQVNERLGPVSVLVNNAGIQQSQPITDTSLADWRHMLAVHLDGAFLCSREAARDMKTRRRGRIINVCSQLGYIGRGGYTAYSTAKGGMIAFTRALARELAPYGILVNGVSPGLVDTGFDPLPVETKRAHAESLPLQRLGTVEDMTSAFVFLASKEGNYYCGQLLHPNGGEIMP